jgi:hypothetical protein
VEQIGSLAGIAAAAALNAGSDARAVELLEATRGILVADTVDARRSDLSRLRAEVPDLAAAFEDLRERRDALDRLEPSLLAMETRMIHAPGTNGAPDPGGAWETARDLARARRDADAEWNRLLDRIRRVEGFAGFLAPSDISAVTAQAKDGTVVFLTAGLGRCDALVLDGTVDDPLRVVPLRDCTENDAHAQAGRLRAARRTAVDPDKDPVARIAAQKEILDVLAWLWDAVAEPILAILGHLTKPDTVQVWPRTWWCPVGVFGDLPIHAAGHHADVDSGDAAVSAHPRTVLDRVVSSYTPTIRALAYARSHPPGITTETVIVAVAEGEGIRPLRGAEAEADTVTALIPGAYRMTLPIRDDVLAALPGHPIAHFACHGEADRANPADSRLILHDHRTAPLTVADISRLRLTGALAYLSACGTSATTPRSGDEAVHLTGAFHLAGYRNVIGTQWLVDDLAAHQVATDFYSCLTDDGTTPPDTGRAALALHRATRNQRARYPLAPTLWVPHTHTGI